MQCVNKTFQVVWTGDYVLHHLFNMYLNTIEETSIILQSLHLINMPEIDIK